ncbi:hypothetical protein LCGC14_3011240, partial [marine sediment metagenome]
MAIGDVLNPVKPSGDFDYEAYRKKIGETAAQTRDIGDTSVPQGAKATVGGLQGVYKGLGETAISQYEQQAGTQKKQAEKAASALEMMGGGTIDYLQRLEQIKEGVTTRAGAARDAWS